MIITELLTPQSIAILDKYGSATVNTLGTDLYNTIQLINSSEMIVPVLGMQGRGKSTLINGILGADVLPNEVDETTCVPVEIKYGDIYTAEVFFDSHSDILNEKEELRQYVDNNYNKANAKGVDRIVMSYPCDLLKSGLILVDLPGVGSMTLANEETTKRYVLNKTIAVFVINVCPSILHTEASFIKACWSQFTSAIFVQNDRGETDIEKEMSFNYNSDVLHDIAKLINCNYSREDTIVINAHAAVKSAIEHDKHLRLSSNIQILESRLSELASNWYKKSTDAIKERVHLALASAAEHIKSLLDDIHANQSDVINKRHNEYNEFNKRTIEFEDMILKTRRSLSDLEEDTIICLKKLIRKTVSDTRANVFLKIDKEHIYDGERLNRILVDEQNAMIDCLSDYLIEKLNELKSRIEDMAQDLVSVIINDSFHHESESINRDKAFKWESHLDVLGGAVGGGVAAGGGAAALAALIVSNPAGWVIGVCGIAICAVGTLLGLGGRKAMRAKRAAEAKAVLRPIFDKIESDLIKKISKNVEDVCESTRLSLYEALNARKKEDSHLKKSINCIPDSEDEKELLESQSYINKLLETL